MVHSQRKGARGERELVNLFKCWWPGGRDDEWGRRGVGQEGADLVTPADFPWTIESKNWTETRVRWFFHPTKYLRDWWEQAKAQTLPGRQPLLCMKVEGGWYALYNKRLSLPDNPMEAELKFNINPGERVYLTTLDEFMRYNEPHIFQLRRAI